MHVDQLRLALAQRLHIAHQRDRVAHARPDMRAVPAGCGDPFDGAGGEVEAVDDRARYVEQLAQRLDDGGRNRVGGSLGDHGLIDGRQDAQALMLECKARVERGIFEQQNDEHEARRGEPIDASGIEAEIEAPAVEHRGESDIEEPGGHHHHQPQIEHAVGAPAPKHEQSGEAQQPHARHDEDHGRRIPVALHNRGQDALAGRGKPSERYDEGAERPDAPHEPANPNRDAARPTTLEQPISNDEEWESAVPEHVKPSRALRAAAQHAGGREHAGKAERMTDGEQRSECVSGSKHMQRHGR